MDIKGKKLHFIGIGGISMSALAMLCHSLGGIVSGSDRAFSPFLSKLASLGCKVYVGSDVKYPKNADIVIYSSAIGKNDIERQVAKKPIERSIFLGQIASLFPIVVAVSGTHGKTTTTCMLASIYQCAGLAFTAHIGGVSRNFCSNLIQRGNQIFLTEACEYKKSFLSLKPTHTLILNIEYDHPDCFADIIEINNAFSELLKNTKKGGKAIIGETPSINIKKDAFGHIDIFQLGKEFFIENIDYNNLNSFWINYKGEKHLIELTQKGEHNIKNATIAAMCSLIQGINIEHVVEGLKSFRGVARRYETIGYLEGNRLILDYAHHPSEIKAVISTAKRESDTVITVFEPHTYSRTASLLKEFAQAFCDSDTVIILPTYSAREQSSEGVDSERLFYELEHEEKYFVSSYAECATLLRNINKDNAIILLLGAGSIDSLREMLIRRKSKK